MMNISIAMATYNGARFIRQQLDSLAAQTLSPCELVVTDDGSTDATLNIIADFAKTAPFPVRVFENETTLGFADNFMKAASLCIGDYIAFCDQDDYWLRNKLEYASRPFVDEEVLSSVHSACIVNENLDDTGRRYPDIRVDHIHQAFEGNPWKTSIPGFALLVRASLLRCAIDWRYRPFAPQPPKEMHKGNQMVAHDHLVYMLSHTLGKTAFIAVPLACYRMHDTNIFGAPLNDEGKHTPDSFFKRTYKSRGIGEPHYRFMADVAEQRAQWMAENCDKLAPAFVEKARLAPAYWKAQRKQYLTRAEIYGRDVNFARKVAAVRSLLGGHAYRAPEQGGFGWRAFAKDIAFGLVL